MFLKVRKKRFCLRADHWKALRGKWRVEASSPLYCESVWTNLLMRVCSFMLSLFLRLVYSQMLLSLLSSRFPTLLQPMRRSSQDRLLLLTHHEVVKRWRGIVDILSRMNRSKASLNTRSWGFIPKLQDWRISDTKAPFNRISMVRLEANEYKKHIKF